MKPFDDNSDVSNYFRSLSDSQFETLNAFRQMLRVRLPEATERIYYQMPTFVLEKPLITYAAFKAHWSLYPCSGSIIPQVADRLSSYKWTKSGIQFPYGHFPSDELLNEIIRLKKIEISEGLAKKLYKKSKRQE